jgi:hypothetical protein
MLRGHNHLIVINISINSIGIIMNNVNINIKSLLSLYNVNNAYMVIAMILLIIMTTIKSLYYQ